MRTKLLSKAWPCIGRRIATVEERDDVSGALPLKRRDPMQGRTSATRRDMSSIREPISILVAEDDGLLRESLVHLLCGEGWAVHSVYEAWSLLAAVSSNVYDLVIMSDVLPATGCIEPYYKVKEIRPEQPVLILEDRPEDGERTVAELSRMDDALRKPFRARAFLAKVRQRLDVTRE